jgi:DNA-binding transcriptional ArsR family regulator
VSHDELEQIAAIYSEAAAAGDRPTLAVQQVFGLPRSTASRRIARARELGLLDPGRVGRGAQRNPKALRVAQALGVTYEDLAGAVLEHAAGDLRIMSV